MCVCVVPSMDNASCSHRSMIWSVWNKIDILPDALYPSYYSNVPEHKGSVQYNNNISDTMATIYLLGIVRKKIYTRHEPGTFQDNKVWESPCRSSADPFYAETLTCQVLSWTKIHNEIQKCLYPLHSGVKSLIKISLTVHLCSKY